MLELQLYARISANFCFNSMQKDPIVSKASELMRLQMMPSPTEIRDGKVRLCLRPGFVVVLMTSKGSAEY